MATNQNNPAVTVNIVSPSEDHTSLRSDPIRVYSTGVLVDDATFTLGATSKGVGFWRCWDSEDLTNAAEFSVDVDGTVTLVVPAWTGANWVASDSDTDLCFYDDSGVLTLKNRQGADHTLHFAKLL